MFVAPHLVGRAAGTAGLGEPSGAVADRVFQGLEALKGCAVWGCLHGPRSGIHSYDP